MRITEAFSKSRIFTKFLAICLGPALLSQSLLAIPANAAPNSETLNAVSGTYNTYSFSNAITGATGDGTNVTFTYTAPSSSPGSDWTVGDYITVKFPLANNATTAYNFGQSKILSLTATTFTVANTTKPEIAKYPDTVALSGLTNSGNIQSGTLFITRDPSGNSTPNGCSLGGTMTIEMNKRYDIPKYIDRNGNTVEPSAGYFSLTNLDAYGIAVTGMASCTGNLKVPSDVVSFSTSGGGIGLQSIDFGTSLIQVASNSLSGSSSLAALNFPDTFRYFMQSAFNGGCNLSSLQLGSSFQHFGKSALDRCVNLKSVNFPSTITHLGEWTFNSSGATEFSFPAGFTCSQADTLSVLESRCDRKIGQYFFGGQQPPGADLAGHRTIDIKIDVSSLDETTAQHLKDFLGTNTSGKENNVGGPNGLGYRVGKFPHITFSNNDPANEITNDQVVDNSADTSGFGADISLASNSFTRSNNTFVGWSTCRDELSPPPAVICRSFTDQQSALKVVSSLKLYAQWSPVFTYTLEFDGNLGTGTPMSNLTGTAANVTPSESTFSRTGYDFAGWNTRSDGLGAQFPLGSKVRFTRDGNLVVFAQWTRNSTPIPTPPEAETPTSTPISTPITTPTTTPTSTPTLFELPLGQGSAEIGGQPVQVTVKKISESEINASIPEGLDVSIMAIAENRLPLAIATDGSLILNRSGFIEVAGQGLKVGSTVQVWLRSDPVLLGTVEVDASGKFTGSFKLPSGLPVGNHTLNLVGVSSSGGKVTLGLGVKLLSKSSAASNKNVLQFAFGTSKLTQADKAKIRKVVSKSGKSAYYSLICGVGDIKSVPTSHEKRLATNRCKVARQYFVKLGVKKSHVSYSLLTYAIGVTPKTKILTSLLPTS